MAGDSGSGCLGQGLEVRVRARLSVSSSSWRRSKILTLDPLRAVNLSKEGSSYDNGSSNSKPITV